MKKFCGSLSEHAMKIINFENKKLKLLIKEQEESYQNAIGIISVIFANQNLKNLFEK